jgi:hypothetical protein
LVHKDLKAMMVLTELLALRAQQEQQVPKELKALQGPRGHKVIRAPQVELVHRALPGQRVRKVLRGLQVPPGHKDPRATTALILRSLARKGL